MLNTNISEQIRLDMILNIANISVRDAKDQAKSNAQLA